MPSRDMQASRYW